MKTAVHIPCGVVVFDPAGYLVWVNPFVEDLLGYPFDELVGKHINLILTVASRIYFQTHIYPLITLGKVANELYMNIQTQKRVSIPVLLNACRTEQEGKVLHYISFIPVYGRRTYEQELLTAKKAAEDALHRNDELLKLKQELERHQVELDSQMSALQQRTDDLEQFGKIVSHDLQEPLRKINIFAGLLANESPDALSDMGQMALNGISKASTRLRNLIGDLQGFFTLSASVAEPVFVDLTELVAQITQEFQTDEVVFDLHPLPSVMGTQSELANLFRHLLSNAVKFRQPGKPTHIRVEGTVVGLNSFKTMPEKYHYVNYARISVSDTGIGFDNRKREEIFRLLKKLHSQKPGLGLGLAFAKRIVERHNGQIAAESTPGKGTKLTVWLPVGDRLE